MKVVLSTVLDFESLEDLADACVECIENSDLTSLDSGVRRIGICPWFGMKKQSKTS